MLMEPVPAVPPGMESGPKGCWLSAQSFSRRMPRVWVVLRLDLSDKRVGDGGDLRAGIEVLGESGDAGVGVGRDRGIVLVEVLEAQRVLCRGVVIEVGHGRVAVNRPVPGMNALSI